MCDLDLRGYPVETRRSDGRIADIVGPIALWLFGRKPMQPRAFDVLVPMRDLGAAGAVPESDPSALLGAVDLTAGAAESLGYGVDLPRIGRYGIACEGGGGELLPLRVGGVLAGGDVRGPL